VSLLAESLQAVINETNVYGVLSASYGVSSLVTRLEPTMARNKLSLAADTLIAMLTKAADEDSRRAAAEGLSVLAPRLDSGHASRAFDAMLLAMTGEQNGPVNRSVSAGLLTLSARIADGQREKKSVAALHAITEKSRSYTGTWFADSLSPALLQTLDRIESLVDLLRDAGCVGVLQSAVLARLEQIAYPEPAQAAVFAGWAADPLGSLTLPAIQTADADHRQQNRRFRTVSDAAKWLAEHHPEIDLDTPYKGRMVK
jgi:hypothetical protein